MRLSDGCSTDSDPDFQAWFSASPRRQVAFHRHLAAWERTERLKSLRPAGDEIDPDLIEALVDPDPSETPAAPVAPPPAAVSRRGFGRIAAAAGVAVLVGAGGAGWLALAPRAYATAVGEQRTIKLDDGVTVAMNTDTRIRVGRDGRSVEVVQGEIGVDIPASTRNGVNVLAAAKSRPLRLVSAAGTNFNVRLRPAEVEVIVTSGQVRVERDEAQISRLLSILSAGAVGAFGEGVQVSHQATAEALERVHAWRAGDILLAGETLAEAAAEFNRYNTRRLVLAEASIADHRLGGYFKANDPETFVRALNRTFGIRAFSRDQAIYLAGPAPSGEGRSSKPTN